MDYIVDDLIAASSVTTLASTHQCGKTAQQQNISNVVNQPAVNQQQNDGRSLQQSNQRALTINLFIDSAGTAWLQS